MRKSYVQVLSKSKFQDGKNLKKFTLVFKISHVKSGFRRDKFSLPNIKKIEQISVIEIFGFTMEKTSFLQVDI